jgi:hypothetical protein
MSANNHLRSRWIGLRRGMFALTLPLAATFFLLVEDAVADVTVYDRAPSVEELQQKLLGGAKADKKQYKTRAIVFDDAPPPAQSAPTQAQALAPQAAPASQ